MGRLDLGFEWFDDRTSRGLQALFFTLAICLHLPLLLLKFHSKSVSEVSPPTVPQTDGPEIEIIEDWPFTNVSQESTSSPRGPMDNPAAPVRPFILSPRSVPSPQNQSPTTPKTFTTDFQTSSPISIRARPLVSSPTEPKLVSRTTPMEIPPHPYSIPDPRKLNTGINNRQISPSLKLPMNSVSSHENSGYSISGLGDGRKIEKQVIPVYPQWALSEMVEGMVTLEFTVTPAGKVLAGVHIRKSSGYSGLDLSGVRAIEQWLFSPIATSENQTATITFRFSLE